MHWLADENLHADLVEWLRGRGDDVVYVIENTRAIADDVVLDLADLDDRIAITQDKDFGTLVFAEGRRPRGVVLLRIGSVSAAAMIERFSQVWPRIELVLEGNFIVITEDRVRIRSIHSAPASDR